MKHISLISLVIFGLAVFNSCNGQQSKNSKKANAEISRIEVIDFHSTHRCMTCKAIEANTQYTLNTYFAKEMKEGKITFQSVNVEEDAQLAEKFEASGTSLFLNVISKGKEEKINLTNFAFSKGRDKDAFSTELKDKTDTEFKKL